MFERKNIPLLLMFCPYLFYSYTHLLYVQEVVTHFIYEWVITSWTDGIYFKFRVPEKAIDPNNWV